METGKREELIFGDNPEPQPVKREGLPPCMKGFACPKGSPDEESNHVLHPRNMRAIGLWIEDRSFGGGCVKNPDAVTRHVFAVIDSAYRLWEKDDLTERLSVALLPLLKAGG